MASSLIPEKPLVISPSLAATIGLEEAVMLQGIHEVMAYTKHEIADGYKWFTFTNEDFEKQFPFWQPGDIQRICSSLRDKGVVVLLEQTYLVNNKLTLALNEKVVAAVSSQPEASINAQTTNPQIKNQAPSPGTTTKQPRPENVQNKKAPKTGRYKMYSDWEPDKEILKQVNQMGIPESFCMELLPEFIHYWQERDEAHHGWGSKFRSWVTRKWREQETLFAAQEKSTEMGVSWQPDQDAIDILVRSGVEHQFITEAVPEFVLYWKERGDNTSSWNSRFVQHVRLQWARYSHAIGQDNKLEVIPQDWQPSHELIEVLHMANIDESFARQLVPEFILYWRERNELHKSWNSKFLQHVKYHWANRHKNNANKDAMGFIERHTDKSWREGI